MTAPETCEVFLSIGLLIEADAPFEKWHERLLSELRGLAGVRFAGVLLDGAARPPVFESVIASAAYRFDSLIARRRTLQLRPAWMSVMLGSRPAENDRVTDILLDLRAVPTSARPPGAQAREVWSVDFLRGTKSPEVLSMRVAVACAGAFPVSLEQVTEAGFKRIDQAVCASRPSAVRNLEQAQQVAIAMVLRTLRARVAGTGVSGGEAPADPLLPGADEDDHPLRFVRNFAAYAAARGADALSKRINARTGSLTPHFRLHHAKGSPLGFSPDSAQALRTCRGQYLADPFLFRHDNRLWAFFEVFDYRDDAGSIGVAELTENGLGPIHTVLGGGGHLSYPYVFAHGGEIYMMPESCARRRIEVWRATRFPCEWELASTALEGAFAVDSDIHFDGSQWWVFTNAAFDPSVDAGLELSIYEADGPLLNTLTPHALNPVVADVRYARNGGRIFCRGGKLYRPAQSLEYGQYGYGLYIMEISRLSRDRYHERPVRFIRGCHHLDSDGEDVIFDLRRGVTPQQATGQGRNS